MLKAARQVEPQPPGCSWQQMSNGRPQSTSGAALNSIHLSRLLLAGMRWLEQEADLLRQAEPTTRRRNFTWPAFTMVAKSMTATRGRSAGWGTQSRLGSQ